MRARGAEADVIMHNADVITYNISLVIFPPVAWRLVKSVALRLVLSVAQRLVPSVAQRLVLSVAQRLVCLSVCHGRSRQSRPS